MIHSPWETYVKGLTANVFLCNFTQMTNTFLPPLFSLSFTSIFRYSIFLLFF